VAITTDDLIGLPHIVILRKHGEIEVHQFEGEDAQSKAIEFGYAQLDVEGVDNIVFACRIHTLSQKLDRIGTLHGWPSASKGRHEIY